MSSGTDPQELINCIAQEAREWRRELHQHPQTMYEETFASDFVAKKLSEGEFPTLGELRKPA